MKSLMVALAIGFLLAGAALLYMSVRSRNFPTPRLTVAGDPFSSLNFIVGFAMLVLTLVSIWIALAAFQSAERSGNEQLQVLQNSRSALESVARNVEGQANALRDQTQALRDQTVTLQAVQRGFDKQAELADAQIEQAKSAAAAIAKAADQMKEQRALLAAVQDTLKGQLEIASEQNKRELEKLSRKPNIQIGVGNLPAELLGKPIHLTLAELQEFTFVLRNEGNEAATHPIIILSTDTEQVGVNQWGSPAHMGRRNVLQLSGGNVNDIEPLDVAGEYSIPVRFEAANDVSQFRVTCAVSASNFKRKVLQVTIEISRPTPASAASAPTTPQ